MAMLLLIKHGQRQSKLANLVYTRELASRYPQLLCVSVHPGFVSTDMIRKTTVLARAYMYCASWLQGSPFVSAEKGALNQLWAAAGAERTMLKNGAYYTPVGVVEQKLDGVAQSDSFAKQLWEWTNEVLDTVSVST